MWTFGFGLSDTTLEYADLKIETPVIASGGDAVVSFIVKNTGLRAGKEVAHVHLRDEISSVTSPVIMNDMSRPAGFYPTLKSERRVILAA